MPRLQCRSAHSSMWSFSLLYDASRSPTSELGRIGARVAQFVLADQMRAPIRPVVVRESPTAIGRFRRSTSNGPDAPWE